MNAKLHNVIITHRDSCKTYALKRIGLAHLVDYNNDKPTMHELLLSEAFIKVDEPEVGCLLIWTGEDSGKPAWYAHSIDEEGKITLAKRSEYGHCGVYEPGNRVSDCRVMDCKSTLGLRHYNDIPKPDCILKLKGPIEK